MSRTLAYLDDVESQSRHTHCGELLAVREFNEENALRKIEHHPFLRSYRIMKNARWVDHMLTCHVLDHHSRNVGCEAREQTVLTNPYLG